MKKCQFSHNNLISTVENGHRGFEFLISCQTKIHRAQKSLEFLNNCKTRGILPKFTEVSRTVLKEVNWSSTTIRNKRLEKLDLAISEQEDRISRNKTKFQNILNSFFHSLPKFHVSKIVYSCFNFVQKREFRIDRNRRAKFEKLSSYRSPKFENIVITNLSDIEIPNEILKILRFGSEISVGGKPDEFRILLELEKLMSKWMSHATNVGVSEVDRFIAKGDFIHSFKLLKKCYGSKTDSKILSKFLNSNPNIVLVKVDKSKNLVFLNRNEYDEKLENEFPCGKYLKLDKNPLDKDLAKFQKVIRTMEPFISNSDYAKLKPIPALKSAYGLLKMHKKVPYPVRPIVSSLNSLVSGAEDFILPILEKFLPECKYSVESTKSFTSYFMSNRAKFYLPRSQILSFDVSKLFPSVDLDMVIKHVIQTIYKSPKNYFDPFVRENGRMVTPPKYVFEPFLKSVLTEFTAFKTCSSFYRQINGCSMGSKLSPLLSNIFLSLIEKNLVDPLLQNGKLISYKRYVDDCFLVIRNRDDIDEIFAAFNNCHKDLKFTKDLPIDGVLNFLDTSIYFDKNSHKYEIKQFSKKIKSNVIQNYKHSVSPQSYKNGTLIGEIYRVKYCSSNNENLEKSLKDLEEKFVANGYPRKLVKSKIIEVRERGFKKKEREIDFEKEKHENPDRFHTVCLNFTSERCSKVEKFIKNFIKKLTPDFRVNFAWKSVSLNNIVLPRLKQKVSDMDSSGLIYKFKCDCSKTYIGETRRLLSTRAAEHGQKSRQTEISAHIFECKQYEKQFNIDYLLPGVKERKLFLFKHFKVLSKGLQKYRDRTIMEALFIRMFKPDLNIQNDHRNTVII